MTCVSPIQPSWISSVATDCPLLRWSDPLTSPPPYYDHDRDEVMCYCIPTYGTHKWSLPPVKRPLDECVKANADLGDQTSSGGDSMSSISALGYRKIDVAYRWFARLLLERSIGLPLPGVLTAGMLS